MLDRTMEAVSSPFLEPMADDIIVSKSPSLSIEGAMHRSALWKARKSELVHDVFSMKGYIGRIQALNLVANGVVKRSELDSSSALEPMLKWGDVREQIRKLLDSFFCEMSPASLFSSGRNSAVSKHAKSHLAYHAEYEWRNREDVRLCIESCRDLIHHCDELVDRLKEKLRRESLGQLKLSNHKAELGTLTKYLQKLRTGLNELSQISWIE